MQFMTAPGAAERPPYHHGNLRHALVEAGVELARHGGPSAIVLREAARRVGVSPNAAYRHFTALPELVEAVALDALDRMAATMEAELARGRADTSAGPAALADLLAVGRGYVNFALAEPGLFEAAFSAPKPAGSAAGAGSTVGAGAAAAVPGADVVAGSAAPGTGTSDRRGGAGRSPGDLLEQALDGMLAAGLLALADRRAAATTAWSAVHGLSMLLLGPLSGLSAAERDGVIEANLGLVARGLLIRE